MKHYRLNTLIMLAILAPLLLAACAGLDLGRLLPPSAPTVTTPVTAGPTAATGGGPWATVAPATAAPDIAATPVLMCTPPACAGDEFYACPSGDCPGGCGTVCVTPTPVTGPLAPAPADWENLESWLTTLWRSNVNPAAVRAALQQSGVQKSLDDWRAADFNDDLLDEWVLVLYDQSLPGVPFGAAGDLWIVNGDGAIFRYYNAPSSDIYEFLAPTILGLTDLTGDGQPELITHTSTCGAHTCYDNYRVIGQKDGGLSDLVLPVPPADDSIPSNAISMSYADTRLDDIDDDGLLEIVVHGGSIGSAGAGVVRLRTEVWGWDGAAVSLTETILDPTTYRHHVLYEANALMAAGDLARAVPLYEATINDGALRDDGYSHAPEQVRADIQSFAAFRLILIDRLVGDTERSASRLAWLQATYPESASATAAATLITEWGGPGGVTAICERIETSLSALDNPTGALADMGYGNPSLGAADFCP